MLAFDQLHIEMTEIYSIGDATIPELLFPGAGQGPLSLHRGTEISPAQRG